jgi:hypothetical protein
MVMRVERGLIDIDLIMEEDFEAELEREYERGQVLQEETRSGRKASLVEEEEKEQDRELKYRKRFRPIGSRPKEEEAEEGVKVKYVRGADGKLKKKVKRKKLVGDGQSASVEEERSQLASSKQESGLTAAKEEEVGQLKASNQGEQSQLLPSTKEESAPLKENKPITSKPASGPSRLKTEKRQPADDQTSGKTNIQPTAAVKKQKPGENQTQTEVRQSANDSADDSDIFSEAGSDYNPSPPPEDEEEQEKEEEESTQAEPTHDYFKGAIGMSKVSSDEQPTANAITSTMEQLRHNASSKQDDEDDELTPTVLSKMNDDDDGYDIEGFMGGEGKWDDDEDEDSSANRKTKKRRKR